MHTHPHMGTASNRRHLSHRQTRAHTHTRTHTHTHTRTRTRTRTHAQTDVLGCPTDWLTEAVRVTAAVRIKTSVFNIFENLNFLRRPTTPLCRVNARAVLNCQTVDSFFQFV